MHLCKKLTIYPIAWFLCYSATASAVHGPSEHSNRYNSCKAGLNGLIEANDPLGIYKEAIQIFFSSGIQLPKSLSRNADTVLLNEYIHDINEANSGINLKFALSPEFLLDDIEKEMTKKNSSWHTRYIFSINGDTVGENHFTAVDAYKSESSSLVSVIQLEPVSFSSTDPLIKETRETLTGLFKDKPQIKHTAVSVGVQVSNFDCAICSLELIKHAHKDTEEMKEMHSENISDEGLSKANIDRLLPISLMTQQQSITAINHFLSKQNCAKRKDDLNKLKQDIENKKTMRIVLDKHEKPSLKKNNGSIEERRIGLVNKLDKLKPEQKSKLQQVIYSPHLYRES